MERMILAAAAAVLTVGVVAGVYIHPTDGQTSPPRPPADAVQEAQTPRDVPPMRPEQRKTEHDRSAVFNPGARAPSSPALSAQPDEGAVVGFDFSRDPFNATKPMQTFEETMKADVDAKPGVMATQRKLLEPERRGETLFFGKAQCSACHSGPAFLDHQMHDLKLERFSAEPPLGPIKTTTLRGIKDSPPALHDGRLLTLEDPVEFLNLVLGTLLTRQEKADLAAFLRQL